MEKKMVASTSAATQIKSKNAKQPAEYLLSQPDAWPYPRAMSLILAEVIAHNLLTPTLLSMTNGIDRVPI